MCPFCTANIKGVYPSVLKYNSPIDNRFIAQELNLKENKVKEQKGILYKKGLLHIARYTLRDKTRLFIVYVGTQEVKNYKQKIKDITILKRNKK